MATGLETLTVKGQGGANDANGGGRQTGPRLFSRTISGTTYQVTGYISSALKVVIGWRIYPYGAWTLYHYDGTDQTDLGTVTDDPHYAVSVIIDADGLVHFSWGMHNEALKYRRSSAALGSWTGGVTAAQSMLGTNESSVAYPLFFVSPVGKLYFTFRDGTSGNGDQYFYKWDDSGDTWSAAVGAAGKLVDGKSTPTNAYLNGAPKFTSDWDGAGTGKMHVSWTWRDSSSDTTNHDVLHVLWDGTNWTKISGSSQTIPITPSNCDTALSVATSSGLLQGDFDLDSSGNPVVVISKTVSGVDQLIAVYRSGGSWTSTQISSFSSGTGQTRIGLPLVVMDRSSNVCYVLGSLRDDSSTDIQQFTSNAADFSTWTHSVYYSQTDYAGTYPVYDRTLWLNSGVLALFIAPWPTGSQSTAISYIKILEQPYSTGLTFPNEWGRKHAITIDHTKVGSGGVSDFSVLLTRGCFLNEVFDPSGSFRAQSDGGDIAFSSDFAGTTRLACHVVRFEQDSSSGAGDGKAEIYVKIPSISSASDTTFYVWYKASSTTAQPKVSSTYGQFSAYDSSRAIFFPFSNRRDSVSKDQIFAKRNSLQPTLTTGKILEGMTPSGVATKGLVLENPNLTVSSAFSIAAWVSVNASLSSAGEILINNSSAASDRILALQVDSSTGHLQLLRYDSSQTLIVTLSGSTDLRGAGFKRVWATFSSGSGSVIYVNGSSNGTNATTTANRSPLGAHTSIGFRTTDNDLVFKDTLDSVEFHTATRSAAWITTDFNNQNDPVSFVTTGSGNSNSAGRKFQAYIIN